MIAAFTAMLAWACLEQGLFVARLRADAFAALRGRPSSGEALAGASELAAERARTDADFARAAALAKAALAHAPLQPQALRVLAWQAEQEGRAARAQALMQLAGSLTQRDNRTHGWLFYAALERADYEGAMRNADAVLRRNPELGASFYPVLAPHMRTPAAREAVVRSLARRPEWREDFLRYLAKFVPDAAAVQATFRLLNARSALSAAEAHFLVERLVADHAFAEAKTVWASTLPHGAARPRDLLYDAGFAGLPGGPPFNWTLRTEGSLSSEISQAPDGSNALHLEYPEARGQVLTAQLMVLPPGTYAFSGELTSDGTRPLELSWNLKCLDDDSSIMTLRHGWASGAWQAFRQGLTVPQSGCAAQQLTLENVPGDGFEVVQVWYRRLALARTTSLLPSLPSPEQPDLK